MKVKNIEALGKKVVDWIRGVLMGVIGSLGKGVFSGF
jgi:hypothetical protein